MTSAPVSPPAPPTYRRTPGCVFRRSHGGVLLVGPDGAGHRLGGSAAAVWLVLERPADETEVALRLAHAHPRPGGWPAGELTLGLAVLSRAGHVRSTPPTASRPADAEADA